MPELIHVSPGYRIYVEGGAVVVHVVCGLSGLPMWLEFSGEAVVGLLNAAQKAFIARPNDRRSRAKQAREAALVRVLREHDWSGQDVCSPRRRTQRWRKKQAEKRKKVANG